MRARLLTCGEADLELQSQKSNNQSPFGNTTAGTLACSPPLPPPRGQGLGGRPLLPEVSHHLPVMFSSRGTTPESLTSLCPPPHVPQRSTQPPQGHRRGSAGGPTQSWTGGLRWTGWTDLEAAQSPAALPGHSPAHQAEQRQDGQIVGQVVSDAGERG